MSAIHFNRMTELGNELAYIKEALEHGKVSGNGRFTELCSAYIRDNVRVPGAFLTTSGTAALEMATLLCDLKPGDEVIMPSFTFTSTANAVVLRGAVPVFVDIRPDTLNMDETLIESAITERTKAIMVVHYAGVACEMDAIMEIADRHGLTVLEDAAQAFHASYRGKPLGSFGHYSAFSFHETKNIVSGEGGALTVVDPAAVERAEIAWEKGTNRTKFMKGLVDKYNWVDVGSSFLPSEITAAFLLAQFEKSREATENRIAIWKRYHEGLSAVDREGKLRIPHPPAHCQHNAHIFWIMAPSPAMRESWLQMLAAAGVNAVQHYVPLHSAPAGLRYGRSHGDMKVTDMVGNCLIRLPMHLNLSSTQVDQVIDAVSALPGGGP
jgi:dTDP-4-amino-4,6-dideoxygalactose transaminase